MNVPVQAFYALASFFRQEFFRKFLILKNYCSNIFTVYSHSKILIVIWRILENFLEFWKAVFMLVCTRPVLQISKNSYKKISVHVTVVSQLLSGNWSGRVQTHSQNIHCCVFSCSIVPDNNSDTVSGYYCRLLPLGTLPEQPKETSFL